MLESVQEDISFKFDEVSIDGNDELEMRYREKVPVVTINGSEAFVLFVHPEALRRRLSQGSG